MNRDADCYPVYLYGDEVNNKDSDKKGTAEIIIGKQRNGPTDTVELAFIDKFTLSETFIEENIPNLLTHLRLFVTSVFILAIHYREFKIALWLFEKFRQYNGFA